MVYAFQIFGSLCDNLLQEKNHQTWDELTDVVTISNNMIYILIEEIHQHFVFDVMFYNCTFLL